MADNAQDIQALRHKDGQEWDNKWKNASTPWDRQGAHPGLLSTLEQVGRGDVPDLPKGGKALVPGCGTGYDVHVFASKGLDTLGIDLSETAVEQAKRWLAAQPTTPARAEICQASFFDLERPEGGFDLFYDYTFLCALPPALRSLWASTYARLAAPSALLITLQFPLIDKASGPPYGLSEAVYEELLGGEWERIWGRPLKEGERRHSSGKGPGVGVEGAGEAIAIWRKRGRKA